MTCVLIEDEIPAGKRLEKLLFQKQFTVLAVLKSIQEVVLYFNANAHPDIVFMDIKLRDDLCFVIFEKIEFPCPIVFTTAFDEFALKAFEHNGLDYLLKPIDATKLDKLMDKIASLKNNFYPKTFWKNIETEFQNPFKTEFLVVFGSNLKKIPIHSIVYFYSINNATFLVTNNNQSYSINYSLDKLLKLIDPTYFFRISRKYIIHKNFFAEIKNNQAILSLNNIPIALDISFSKLKACRIFFGK